jgi:hypothetical protein
LHRAGHDEDEHAAGQAADERPRDEDDDAGLEDALAPEQVAELAGQDGRDRLGEHVRRHDPAQMTRPAKIPHDRRQGARHDRLVQGRQQEPQQDRDEHDVPLRS